MHDDTTAQEGTMNKTIKAGGIPHEIQRDVISAATEAACTALRGTGESNPAKAARQVAEAAVAAWQIVNGVSCPSPSPDADGGTRR